MHLTDRDQRAIAHALREQAEDQEIIMNQAMEAIVAVRVKDPHNPGVPVMLKDLEVIEGDIINNLRLARLFETEVAI